MKNQPWNMKNHEKLGPQLTSFGVQKRYVTDTGPKRPFKCLDTWNICPPSSCSHLHLSSRQGTSSQYQKSYLDLGFWYCICPTQPIITNTETAMLSISNDWARWKPQSCKSVRLARVWGSVKHVYIVHVLARVLYTRASTCVYARARTQ